MVFLSNTPVRVCGAVSARPSLNWQSNSSTSFSRRSFDKLCLVSKSAGFSSLMTLFKSILLLLTLPRANPYCCGGVCPDAQGKRETKISEQRLVSKTLACPTHDSAELRLTATQ